MLCAVARVSRIDPWMDALLAASVMMRSCPCTAMLRHGQVVAAVACVVARSDVVWWPESDVMLMRSLNGRRWRVVQLDGGCVVVAFGFRHRFVTRCWLCAVVFSQLWRFSAVLVTYAVTEVTEYVTPVTAYVANPAVTVINTALVVANPAVSA